MKTANFTTDVCIVSLSSSPWDYPLWASRQFLMYELSQLCPVVYATGRIHARELLNLKQLKNTYMHRIPPFAAPDHLFVQKPPLFAPKIFKFKGLDKKLANFYGRLLRKRCKKASNGKIVAYVWEPMHRELIDGLQPDLVVYHPYDKFEAMAKTEASKKQVRLSEIQMAERADIVITPHQRIAATLNHPSAHVIHNAVFTPAMPANPLMSDTALRDIPHPRLGYIGMISAKLDFPLIMEIARKKSDFSIILMGPENPGPWQNSETVKALHQIPNLYFFPAVRFDQVFDHMLQFDIGIMPYSLSTHMAYCESPLKMYQYWLCGLPIVTSRLPNIFEQPSIISIADTPSEWINKIEQLLDNNSDSIKTQRKKLAMENSYQNRAQTIYQLLRNQLK